ncbi:MAG: hypothetical protein M9911_09780 [Saprospiraceae bacterium]|nr:hypothetical protein [Saprospiraceae bacterium]
MSKTYYATTNILVMWCIFFIFLGIPFTPLSGQSDYSIKVGNVFDEAKVVLNWAPTNDTLWAWGNKYGYSIARIDALGEKTILAEGIKPYPHQWFISHKEDYNGMVGVLGDMLYDPTFSTKNVGGNLTNQQIQYNYIVPEAITNPTLGISLGLSFVDSTGLPGQRYTYEIILHDSTGVSYVGRLELANNPKTGPYNLTELYSMPFNPPGGVSLSGMVSDKSTPNRIEVVAKAYQDSIVLRWAPNNASFWVRTQHKPYAVFRLNEVSTPDTAYTEYIFLDSIQQWEIGQFTPDVVKKDSLLLVAAQCMYGARETSDKDGIIMQFSESQMRYGMAMLAADRSPLAATSLGLRYVDRDVKPGHAYSYVIMTREALNITENGLVSIRNEKDTLARINGFYAEPADGRINLKWNKLNDQYYSGYKLERSDDGGKTYKALHDAPLLIIHNPLSSDDGFYHFADSLTQNKHEYLYRLMGIDAFGELSDPVTIAAQSVDKTPPSSPVIYIAEASKDGSITLKWEMPKEEIEIGYFQILLADNIETGYEVIADKLPVSQKSYHYTGPVQTDRSYYFIVAAYDLSNNQIRSAPAYVPLVDSVAPAIPKHLEGYIDSLGRVNITWDQNLEKDLIGYRVYMGNNPEHEFAQITKEPTVYNAWRDSVSLISLDKKVYYKVSAVDRSFNQSAFSEIISLKRPDIIPPAAPASLPASSGTSGIELRWTPSSSEDVAAYIIYRKDPDGISAVYQRIMRVSDAKAIKWTDTTALPLKLYQYIIKAQDSTGLLSEPSFPVKGRKAFDLNTIRVKQLKATYRPEYSATYLEWKSPILTNNESTNFHFYLYRKADNGSWKKIKQLGALTYSYLDRDLKINGKYIYGIKLVLNDGNSGAITESNSINFIKK